MKKIVFSGICVSFFLLLIIVSCRKGEIVSTQQYMRLSVEAFFTDTALHSNIQLDDSLLRSQTDIYSGNTALAVLPFTELKRPSGDSARLEEQSSKKMLHQ